ncbi:MAG: hypothetical protein ABS81_06145 [Pseudonocardia sp. SCN 72-86]|nr:MAG: hypothetical protein ABS81_06145 [Pseudonocardia sp. SCN 72-86]
MSPAELSQPGATAVATLPGIAGELERAVGRIVADGDLQGVALVADSDVQRILTAAVRLYAASSEARGDEFPPFLGTAVAPTDAVVVACALLRAMELTPFELALWFSRPVAAPAQEWVR